MLFCWQYPRSAESISPVERFPERAISAMGDFQVSGFQVGDSQDGDFQAEIIKIFTLKIEFAYPKL